MKKILISILLVVSINVKAFAVSWQIHEAESFIQEGKYKQALESVNSSINSDFSNKYKLYVLRITINQKLGNYEQAINDINIALKYGKADKNSSILELIHAMRELAKDTKAPIITRIELWNMISKFYEMTGNETDSLASMLKMIQLISFLPEDSSYFKNSLKSKKELIKNRLVEIDKPTYDEEILLALWEYSIGNKTKGVNIANEVINEVWIKQGTIEANELRKKFSYIKGVLDD